MRLVTTRVIMVTERATMRATTWVIGFFSGIVTRVTSHRMCIVRGAWYHNNSASIVTRKGASGSGARCCHCSSFACHQ